VGSFLGSGQLVRLILRLDRIRLSVWVLSLGLIPVAVAASFATLYDTELARRELVGTVVSSPGLTALLGPISGSSVGALTAWRIGTIGAVLVALMAGFTVVRHTRHEEETGRRELLGSTVLGRHAPLVAASGVTIGVGALIGVMVATGLVALGEDAGGSVAFGASWALISVVFAAVGALAAQLTESSGGARGIVAGSVGVFYALRMAGDSGEGSGVGWMSWLSPFGWVSKIEAFGDEQWWVIALFVIGGLILGSAGFVLSAGRDVGASVFASRPGPPIASRALSSPLGLAWRLQRGRVFGWSVGVLLFAAIWGGLGNTITDLFEDNPQLASIFESLGGAGALTDIFFSAAMGIVALIVSAYAISVTLTLRSEETGLRAEHVLATPTPRLAWVWSHLTFALIVPVLLMSLAGAAAGLIYGTIVDDVPGWLGSLLGSSLLQVPAIWVVAGVVMLLYGLAPRFASWSWAALVGFLLLGQLGPILQLPQWAMNLSPFTHVPAPPEPVSALPVVALGVVSVALLGVGLGGFRSRDLT
jgi:ABC-2 type transport system permease protein